MKNWKQDCTLRCWKDRCILALFFTGCSKGFYLWLHWFLQIRRPSCLILATLFKLEGAWRGELFPMVWLGVFLWKSRLCVKLPGPILTPRVGPSQQTEDASRYVCIWSPESYSRTYNMGYWHNDDVLLSSCCLMFFFMMSVPGSNMHCKIELQQKAG